MKIFKKFKTALLVLSALALMFGYLTPVANATTDVPKPSKLLLNGQKAEDYIKLANESAVYKKTVSSENIEDAQVMLLDADVNLNVPEDAVVVSGAVGGDETDSVQIFISVAEQKVVKISHLKATGLEDYDTFTLTAYDENGILRGQSSGTLEDMANGKVKVEKVKVEKAKVEKAKAALGDDDVSIEKVNKKALWWACQFSSLLVCLGAAGVNVLLGIACRAAFKLAAC